MNRPEQASEPSMDEILASIRRIIAEDPAGTPSAGPAQVIPANGKGDLTSRPSLPAASAGLKTRIEAAAPARQAPPPLPAAAPSVRDLAADDDILDLVDAPAAPIASPPPPPAAPAPRSEASAGPMAGGRPLTPRPLSTRPEFGTQVSSTRASTASPVASSHAAGAPVLPGGATSLRPAPPPLPRATGEAVNGRTPLRLDAPPLPPVFSDAARARPALPAARNEAPPAALDIGTIVPRREGDAGPGEPAGSSRLASPAPLGNGGMAKPASAEMVRQPSPSPALRPGLGDVRRDKPASETARPLEATEPLLAPETQAEVKPARTDKPTAISASVAPPRPLGSPPAGSLAKDASGIKLDAPARPSFESVAKPVSGRASELDIAPPRFGPLFRDAPAGDLPTSLRARATDGTGAAAAAKTATTAMADAVARTKDAATAEAKEPSLAKVRVAAPTVDFKTQDASIAPVVKPADAPLVVEASTSPPIEAVTTLAAPAPSHAAPKPDAAAISMKVETGPPAAASDAAAPLEKAGAPLATPPVALVPSPSNAVAAATTRSLEDAVSDLLRPMLRSWLDDNMPRIVEKIAREELAKPLGTPDKADAKADGKKAD